MNLDRVGIVGAGRVGRSLGRALERSGTVVSLLGRHDPLPPVTLVLVAVPDDAIDAVAARLRDGGGLTAGQVVLHTSGLHDRTALAALDSSGAALGSFHPLQTFVHPDGEPEQLAGAAVVVEGDRGAVAMGRALAARLDMAPVVELATGQKAAYHAGAVFAGNYLVVLAEIATRLAREAGAGEAARALYLPLMRRALENVAAAGPAALSGPIRRGDSGTVARHLELLHGNDRDAYVVLGREALQQARDAGLDPAAADAIARLLY